MSRPPPFTRCRARAQVQRVPGHAEEILPFVVGVQADSCVVDFVLRLTNFVSRGRVSLLDTVFDYFFSFCIVFFVMK